MSDRPLVSVIVPTYMRAHCLGACVESVLNQSYENFELIVVDDCSPDDGATAALLEGYNDERIRFIGLDARSNGANARNQGILAANGAFIFFLDSDDQWRSHKLERSLSCPGIKSGIVYSRVKTAGIRQEELPSRAIKSSERVGDYLLLNGGAMQTSSLGMSRSLALQVMFDGNLKRFQDYDFVLRAEQAGVRFFFIEETLVIMTSADQSNRISNSYDYAYALNWLRDHRQYLSSDAQSLFLVDRACRYAMMSGDSATAFCCLLQGHRLLFKKPTLWLRYLTLLLLPFGWRNMLISKAKQHLSKISK